ALALDQNITRRNAPQVVAVVNELFRGQPHFLVHEPYQRQLPGAVEVLPLTNIEEALQPEAARWRNPLHTPRANQPDRRRELEAQQLAANIGKIVGRWKIEDQGTARAARYQDVMLLVTRRTHLEVYERALRHAQIPYVSSRQGGLLDTLESDDLTSLLHFLVVPFADLQLATALKSPVFSVSDDDLMALAATEGRTWWQRLEKLATQANASTQLIRAQRLLSGWLAAIDRLPVHDLLDRIYFEGDLVRRYEHAVPAPMRMAVGANLRAFMEVALATDSGRYPSLQGFLHELSNLQRATPEEAPDVGMIAEGADAVRILTVHGAKGLEAPIVGLLDANAADRRSEGYSVLVDWPPEADAPLHFSLYSRQDERGVSRTLLFERDESLSARENLNLLYVAMTRAKQALFVSGSEGRGSDGSWYHKIAEALAKAAVSRAELPRAEAAPLTKAPVAPETLDPAVLDSLCRPLDVGSRTDTLIDPRRRYGVLLHALLERVTSPSNIDDRQYLMQLLKTTEDEFSKLWNDAQSIITAPEMRRFFDPAQYLRADNELAYAGESGEMRRIDRLVEFDDSVWILDYKTGDAIDPANLEVSARPYRTQLAEYRAAVTSLVSGKPVKSALVFAGGLLLPVDD
ncbi:MAG: UvrD-helicase domain-containing protein, partial [Burkholderiales bacterium]